MPTLLSEPVVAYLVLFTAQSAALARLPLRGVALLTAIALGCAMANQQCSLLGLAWVGIGATLCVGARHPATAGIPAPRWRRLSLALLGLWSLAAALHALPGFSPLTWAADFGRSGHVILRWQLDKGLAGLLLLCALRRPSAPGADDWLIRLFALPLVTLSLLALAWLCGLASPDPRWLPHAAVWLAGNLFLTVLAEEAFFRCLLQGALQRALMRWPRQAYALALGLSSTLFAAVHLPWGATFAGLALLAGLFYGAMAGPERRLGWAIAAHFFFNAATLLLMRSPLG